VLRVAVRHGGRGRVVEADDVVSVGADPSCGVQLLGRGVAPRHAVFFERRGRVVVRAAGRFRVLVDGVSIEAPVVLAPTGEVTVGDYALRPRVGGGGSWVGAETEVGPVLRELDDPEAGARRYEASSFELVVPDRGGVERWRDQVLDFAPDARWIRHGEHGGLAWCLPQGVTAAEVMAAVARGGLHVPVEAIVVVAARVVEDLRAWGDPHGSVWPERVHLSSTGDVRLGPPGPEPGWRPDAPERFLRPERRMGAPLEAADDRFALRGLIVALAGDARRVSWLLNALEGDGFSILERAARANLDPAAHHVARVVGVSKAMQGSES